MKGITKAAKQANGRSQAVAVRVPGLVMDLPIYNPTWGKGTVECLMKCTIHT